MDMLEKIKNNPVALAALFLVLVMVVQKLWLGEVIDREWVEWVLGLFGVATGTAVVRQSVTPTRKLNKDE